VKDARGESSIGLASGEDVNEVIDGSSAARRDNGNADGVTDRRSQFAIEAGPGSVGIHRRKQDFTGAALLSLTCPLNNTTACGSTATLNKDLSVTDRIRCAPIAAGINRHNNGLGTEVATDGINQSGIGKRGGIDADLVCTSFKDLRGVAGCADAPTNSKGHEQLPCGAADCF
jgi:hypothetical protein